MLFSIGTMQRPLWKGDLVGVIFLALIAWGLGHWLHRFQDHVPSRSGVGNPPESVNVTQASSPPPHPANPPALPEILSLDQMKEAVSSKGVLILDARLEILYQLGHLPGALSLPWEHFEEGYARLRARLESHHDRPIVIYCSGLSCELSGLEAAALRKRGFSQISRFQGGWEAWQNAGLPREQGSEPSHSD